jgi:hypothetical protein
MAKLVICDYERPEQAEHIEQKDWEKFLNELIQDVDYNGGITLEKHISQKYIAEKAKVFDNEYLDREDFLELLFHIAEIPVKGDGDCPECGGDIEDVCSGWEENEKWSRQCEFCSYDPADDDSDADDYYQQLKEERI